MVRLLAFTWNANRLSICETDYEDVRKRNREKFFNVRGKKPCFPPVFFETVESKIKNRRDKRPEIVAFSTQDEAESQTYFHSEFLPKKMKNLGYEQYYRKKLENVGHYNFEQDEKLRTKTSLRLSVYIVNNRYREVKSNKNEVQRNFRNESLYDRKYFSGALGCYVKIDDKIICICGGHYPTEYIKEGRRNPNNLEQKDDYDIDKTRSAFFLFDILVNFYLNKIRGVFSDKKCDNIFILGDFGFDSETSYTGGNVNVTNLRDNDSFNEVKNDFDLKEGKNNRGVTSIPTWPRNKENKLQNGSVGWRDRIVYKGDPIDCEEYTSIENESEVQPVHSPVYGIFKI